MRLLPKGHRLGYAPYLWLVYLAFFAMYPVFRRASALEWAATVAGIAVFLPLYFAGFRVKERKLLYVVGGIAALGTVFAPFNPGASAMFIYAAAFVGDTGPSKIAVRWLGVLLLWMGAVAWLFQTGVQFWGPGLVISAVVGGANIHFCEQERQGWRLRLAQQEIEHLATVAERERIARDLHDLLGHTLSLIVLKSELASRLAGRDNERAFAEIRDVERVSREALAQVREAVRGYRSSGVEGEARAASAALEAAGVKVTCSISRAPLSPAQETVVALAIRESATNIIRHAQATEVRIGLTAGDGRIALEIADNGRGFDGAEGSGLRGMRERVQALGGSLSLESARGTRVLIELPGGAAQSLASGVA